MQPLCWNSVLTVQNSQVLMAEHISECDLKAVFWTSCKTEGQK